jgi:hypothetical protein
VRTPAMNAMVATNQGRTAACESSAGRRGESASSQGARKWRSSGSCTASRARAPPTTRHPSATWCTASAPRRAAPAVLASARLSLRAPRAARRIASPPTAMWSTGYASTRRAAPAVPRLVRPRSADPASADPARLSHRSSCAAAEQGVRQAVRCGAHREPGDRLVLSPSRRCSFGTGDARCTAVASFGSPGERASRCAAHKEPAHENVVSRRCAEARPPPPRSPCPGPR